MTSQLAPTPIFKAFDNLGLPLAFGLLYTYQAGTITPQATYTDSSGSAPNPNPVVLNARGEAPIWLNPTLNYKFLLTDAFGNQIPGWPVDNINGSLYPGNSIIPNTSNAFTLGNAQFSWANVYVGPNNAPVLDSVSGNIGYYARTAAEIAAGVTPTNYAYHADPYVDPRRYGADSSGVTDSTVAVQTAINVAYRSKSMVWIGGACNFLVGALSLTATGNHTTDGLIIRGSAPNGSRLTQNGSPGAILAVTGSTPTGNPQEFPFTLRDLSIVGNGLTADGVQLIGVSDATIENCIISGCNRAIYGNSCLTSKVNGCWLAGNKYGIYVRQDGAGASANLWRITFNQVNNNATYGIDYDQGSELIAIGNDIEQNGTAGNANTGAIHIGSSINASPTFGFGKVSCEDNWLEGNLGGYAIQADAPTLGQNTWICIRGGHTVSTANGTAINIAGTGTAGHVVIENHYSPSVGDTWTINSAYATLRDAVVNILADTVTYPTYNAASTGTVNHRNGRVDGFTGTITGCTTSPQGTVSVHLEGDEVVLDFVNTIQGISNTTACTMTGIPTQYQPQNTVYGSLLTGNNSANVLWPCQVSAGTITLGFGQTFAASGTKGLTGGQLRYRRS